MPAACGRFAQLSAGQSGDVYWTFSFVWRGEDLPEEDVDRYPPAEPGFHHKPPTR